MNARDAWGIAYNQLELQLDRGSFNTWLRGATFIDEANGVFRIAVRNTYARDMLQHRLYRNVRRVLSDVCAYDVEIEFVVQQAAVQELLAESDEMPLFQYMARTAPVEADTPLHETVNRPSRVALPESELNPRFRFERFIVNGANRITYEAALSVAENPAGSYNPLLIYGGVGLGKTHLLQAIGHVCNDKGLRTMYIPSEVFTNDLVTAIRSKTTAMFRDKYRSVDVLLVDDIQFIAGKDSTQEEFFHTFNTLYTFNKQIILASDRHPSEMERLEDRLRSRFQGGLVTDVQPLEYESRLALLEMWVQERKVVIEPSVLHMVAERASSNIRELEGLFNQVLAKLNHETGPLTLHAAEHTLQRFEQPRVYTSSRLVTADQVVKATAQYFKLKPQDLRGKRRTGRINQARQIAMYLVRELTECSLPQIGDIFGGRSHSTVLHGCNKIAEEMEFDLGLRHHIQKIREGLA